MQGRGRKLFEGASAILFFGVLANQPVLEHAARSAFAALSERGYRVPSIEAPVYVRPLEQAGLHAGEWRPGNVRLTPNPRSGISMERYLQHELMHEVNYRTCDGSFPVWANEASAIAFSGETSSAGGILTAESLRSLAKAARLGVPLSPHHMTTLTLLVREHGWPTEPCATSAAIADIIARAGESKLGGGLSYVLMHAVSGRIFTSAGAVDDEQPLGSLMKLPYVASLRDAGPEDLEALLASDTETLRARAASLNQNRYQELVAASGRSFVSIPELDVLLGERDVTGKFPLQFSLPMAARLLRATLLVESDRFGALSRQTESPAATLAGSSPEFKAVLRGLNAGAKTGSISTPQGTPLLGYLAVFWPAAKPQMLAVFRKSGVRGATLADDALPYLREWKKPYRFASKSVRVSLLTRLPRQAWMREPLDAECPELEIYRDKQLQRMTGCGGWRIRTDVHQARAERFVAGLFDGDVLETDVESYVDAVVEAEGDTLKSAAEQALRATVTANALRGGLHRHPNSQALCDTTHCMVFMGWGFGRSRSRAVSTDGDVVDRLLTLDPEGSLPWYPFSVGGDEPWTISVSNARLIRLTGERTVLDVRRERTRDSEVRVRFMYAEGEESVPCDTVMLGLELPACPDTIRSGVDSFVFSGRGRGHADGLSVARAEYLAGQGRSAEDILEDAFSRRRRD